MAETFPKVKFIFPQNKADSSMLPGAVAVHQGNTPGFSTLSKTGGIGLYVRIGVLSWRKSMYVTWMIPLSLSG